MWKWLKALNPFESDSYAPWMREEIAALRDQLDAAEIELADRAFYVREFAAVSRERNEYKNLLDVRTKDLDSQEKSYQKALAERDELEARLAEFTRDRPSDPGPGAIYVDLDGTLAYHEKWVAPEIIGEPIPAMMERVKTWIAEGKIVKIFTARFVEHHCFVRAWLKAHGLGQLEVTSHKGIDGIEFWDDRAVQIEPNTGVNLLEEARSKIDEMESENESAKQRAEEKNARIVAALKRVEYTGHATSLPDAVEWCVDRIAGLTAELQERRAEQAPLGDEVIALRKQVSDLRSKHTETCVHNGQIAMLLAQAWEQIAKLGGDPITENALIEHIKAGRKRDMETVKQYAEEAGQLRNTITAIKAELKERRAEQAPMGDEIVNLRAELAALRERAAVPVPAGVPSVRDLREIGVHAYLSHDSAKRENAGCMVGPMGAAADAIRDAVLRGAEQPSSNAGQFDDDEVEALARVLRETHAKTCGKVPDAYELDGFRNDARAAMDWMGAPVGECKECEKLRKRGDKLADDCVKLAGAIKNARAALADNPCRRHSLST